ncbi:MAG TPA: GntR family transcriptional regulator [Steroidobacteraceae bacterium]
MHSADAHFNLEYGGPMVAGKTTSRAAGGKKPPARLSDYLAKVPTRGSMSDAVSDALREAILDGTIPAASWLREEDLAAELRVSRTPLREAIRRLTIEGLAIRVPNQGTQVAPVSMEDILAIYAVREFLEGLAARLAAQRGKAELHGKLRDLQQQYAKAAAADDVTGVYEVNLAFHRAIREASNNRYLENFLTLVEHSVRRFGETTFETPGRMTTSVDEHEALVDAIVNHETDEAERLARAHMREARETRVAMFLEQNT